MADALYLYNRLVAEVDCFLDGVHARLSSGMVCGPGCDACCRSVLTLLPVEAFRLRQGFDRLTASGKRQVTDACSALSRALSPEGRSGPCPLLHDGKCALYEYRPLVCRTHGFPLYSDQFREAKGTPVDFCHLNFTGKTGIETIGRGEILNVDLLGRKLFVANESFVKETGRVGAGPDGASPDERISMVDLFIEREVTEDDK